MVPQASVTEGSGAIVPANDPPAGSTPKAQIGLDLRLVVGSQLVPIHMDDVDKVRNGEEPFSLVIPRGIQLKFDELLKFLEQKFQFSRDSLPDSVKGLLTKSEIILNELWFLADKPNSPGSGAFKVSITVAFDKGPVDPTQPDKKNDGGLLGDLLGVDMSAIIDIQEVTVTFTKGAVPTKVMVRNVPPAALPSGESKQETPAEPLPSPS